MSEIVARGEGVQGGIQEAVLMRLEVIGEYKDGSLEVVGENGKRYLARFEKDEDGLVVAINLEECA